jgi:predicted SprT family Zn-dependent metalloprotease
MYFVMENSKAQGFLDRGLLLTRKLLNQGLLSVKLKSSLRTFYSRKIVTWLISTEYMCYECPRIYSTCRKHFLILSSYFYCGSCCSMFSFLRSVL